jgi:predicted O-linked N-acetylglucosamine transferase (SPINDLY family)
VTDGRALLAQAIALHRAGDLERAEALYRDVLASRPDDFDALHLLGLALHQQGRDDAAVASISRALAVDARDPNAHANLGLALRNLGRHDEALASFDRALAIRPDHPATLNNRGNALRMQQRPEDALASYDRALSCQPDYAIALRNRGDVLLDLARPDEALAALARATACDARDGEAWNLRGIAEGELGRFDESVASFRRAVDAAPLHRKARFNLGGALVDCSRFEEAASVYGELAAQAPDHPFVRGQWLHAKMRACQWDGLAELAQALRTDVAAGRPSAEPFGYQAIATSPRDLLRCAQVFAAEHHPPAPAVWRGERFTHPRIRIGYLSGEFRRQATSMLIVELLERHDRERFEVLAFDNGGSDGSALRTRIERGVDAMVDIRGATDADAATLVRQREVDVLVNLNGYFGRLRQGVFARRPAPIQVNYLGFPGTLGAPYIDYLIADAIAIPPGEDDAYAECIVRLPDCYQPNDTKRPIATDAPSRAEAGLPERGFVFCCFNNNYKIVPAMFDVWMRLLRAIDGSVLWLFEDNRDAARNLRREAVKREVAAERVVFAQRMPPDRHLARHRLADLFVDTLPYNAHTTASDALWAGLPLVTLRGTTFPGRVAASLLFAAGLPDLVTTSLADYEALALRLATSPATLADARQRLAQQRDRCALFDIERYRRHIEGAYATMVERQRRGDPPVAFDVPRVA